MTRPTTRLARLDAEEDGLSAGAEALVFGVLVFVVGGIIMLNGWAVLDAHFAVNAAAREATRTIVDAGAVERTAMVGGGVERIEAGTAYRVAVETMSGHGKDPATLPDPDGFVVRLADDPWSGAGGPPERCARVTVEVTYPVQGIRLPIIGGWQTPVRAEGQHTEIIDPFRSGLTGRADCG
jgi:hypothetical protein